MRISTSQIYESGTVNIQRNQSALYKLQNQLSTGRRVLTPEDDPVAAAQALLVTQSREITAQHIENQGNADSQLGLVDSQLSSLGDLLQHVREKVIQAGNTATLSNTDRQAIATELEARLSEMLGIANTQNGTGEFLFSGYQGGTRPFAIDASVAALPPASTSPVGYFGDDGERLLQVSSSRQMAVNVAGSEVFMQAKSGNGTFAVATGGNLGGGNNQGTAISDAGSVLDPQKWALAVNNPLAGQPLEIRFSVAAGVTTYGVYDPVSAVTTGPLAFTPGQAIPLLTSAGVDFGSQLVVQGVPANDDTFTVTPSASQSLFQTMQNLIGILRSSVGSATYSTTEYTNALGGQLTNLDQAFGSISRVQASVGSRMRELDSLGDTSSDLNVQHQQTLSKLQDLDYAKAISEYTQQQVQLEAAQKSFVQISSLSLFNYL
jgi:flagellar hook-associated protein 3 FlgL